MDVNRGSEESKGGEYGQEDSICLLCKTLLLLFMLLAMLGGIVSILSFGVYFLVVDHGKGGSCASGAGRDIWTYFLIKLIVGVFTQCFTTCFAKPAGGSNSDNMEGSSKRTESEDAASLADRTTGGGKVTSILLTLLLHVGMLGYGGIVLIHEKVCAQYENTGLYQMAYALFFLDCTFLFIAVSLGFFACLFRGEPEEGEGGGGALQARDSAKAAI